MNKKKIMVAVIFGLPAMARAESFQPVQPPSVQNVTVLASVRVNNMILCDFDAARCIGGDGQDYPEFVVVNDDKPQDNKPQGDKPQGDKPQGDKPLRY